MNVQSIHFRRFWDANHSTFFFVYFLVLLPNRSYFCVEDDAKRSQHTQNMCSVNLIENNRSMQPTKKKKKRMQIA